jgi:hypothetical protein
MLTKQAYNHVNAYLRQAVDSLSLALHTADGDNGTKERIKADINSVKMSIKAIQRVADSLS